MPDVSVRRLTRPTRPCDAFPERDWRRWRQHVLDLDTEVLFAAAIAETVNQLIAERRAQGDSLRDMAAASNVATSTISELSRCQVYAKVGSVARLEETYRRSLWPAIAVFLERDAAMVSRYRDQLPTAV